MKNYDDLKKSKIETQKIQIKEYELYIKFIVYSMQKYLFSSLKILKEEFEKFLGNKINCSLNKFTYKIIKNSDEKFLNSKIIKTEFEKKKKLF